MDLLVFVSSKGGKGIDETRKAAEFAAKKFRKDLHVEFLDLDRAEDRLNALQFRITSAPGIVLDGEVVFPNRIPKEEELAKLVEEKLAKAKAKKPSRTRGWSVSGLPEGWGNEGP